MKSRNGASLTKNALHNMVVLRLETASEPLYFKHLRRRLFSFSLSRFAAGCARISSSKQTKKIVFRFRVVAIFILQYYFFFFSFSTHRTNEVMNTKSSALVFFFVRFKLNCDWDSACDSVCDFKPFNTF